MGTKVPMVSHLDRAQFFECLSHLDVPVMYNKTYTVHVQTSLELMRMYVGTMTR
jgi:hypothetical protein